MAVQLFLSCVSDEFGAYRDALRRALTRPNVEVKIQEDFKALGGDTLMKLEAYIKRCEAVVHFVGDMAGSQPKDFGVQALVSRHPDIKGRLPPLCAAIDAGAPISYPQWEAWLALYFDKDLVIAAPGPNFARDLGLTPKLAPTEQCRAAQAAHLERLKAVGRYPEVRFANADNLVAQIFASAVIDALVKAAAKLDHQPRNLPFASLGSLFMGRDTALDDLRAALMSGKGAAVTGRALHGLGGIGKTRLAIEYAHWRETDYSMLLFVRAKDRATLQASLAALAGAEVLNLRESEAPQDAVKIEAVLKRLDANPTWLMILDNVDDDEAVKAVSDLMARLKGGHVIVTARAANFPASIRKLSLDALNEDAATEFLLERTRNDRASAGDDAAQARALAHELGGLALGLEQAGAYIARQHIGFARYLALWREKRDSVLKWFDKSLMSYDHDVGLAATWAASVGKLTPESRRLLDRLAFLAPDPVPDSLIDVPVPGEAPDYDAYEARAGLYAYSLATQAKGEDGAAKGFVVHRLVQDFARRAMTDDRPARALREALGWVNAAFLGDPDDVRNWPVLDPLAPHALAVARRADEAAIGESMGRLFNQLGLLFRAKARYSEAEPLYRRALANVEQSLGTDHPHLATTLNNLALLLKDTNRLGEAEPLYRRALAIREASLGPDHPDVAQSLSNLALLLQDTKRPAEAEPLYRRTLAIDEASYGPDHAEVATDLNNLAGLLNQMDRPAEAEPLYRRALAIFEKSYGTDHPKVATCLNNLAGLLRDTNRLGEAEPLYRRALKIDEASLGLDHPKVAIRLNNLASLLQDTNRLAEAELLYRRALAIFKKSLGPDHPNTAIVRENLAALVAALGKGA
jgi:tetratricopeptide (TPR) repeat protein